MHWKVIIATAFCVLIFISQSFSHLTDSLDSTVANIKIKKWKHKILQNFRGRQSLICPELQTLNTFSSKYLKVKNFALS